MFPPAQYVKENVRKGSHLSIIANGRNRHRRDVIEFSIRTQYDAKTNWPKK